MARTKRPAPPCLSSSEKESSSSEEEDVPAGSEPEDEEEQGQDQGQEEVTKSVKRAKKQKKRLFQRVWTQSDEIALLESAMHFKAERDIDVLADVNSFYEFTKARGLVRFKTRQLKEKYLRFQKRYLNNVKKDTDGNFQLSHDQKIYNLSKQIWSTEDNKIDDGGDAEVKGEQQPAFVVDKNIGVGGMEGMILSHRLDKEKADVMKKRWRKFHAAEVELFLVRNQLVHDQAKDYLDALNSGSNR